MVEKIHVQRIIKHHASKPIDSFYQALSKNNITVKGSAAEYGGDSGNVYKKILRKECHGENNLAPHVRCT